MRPARAAPMLVLAAAMILACSGSAPAEPGGSGVPGARRVLFVGNSLTYTNDLPRLLAEVAAAGGETIEVGSVALPDFALVDHAAGLSDAVRTIQRGRWDLVVMQQGPSSRPLNQDTLAIGARQLEGPIRAAGARPALYMVWPARSDLAFFDAVRDSYRRAACAVDGVFLPAGEAWRTAWRSEPALPLYGPDGFHPSLLGSYLAALVIYERVTGQDARSLPAAGVVANGRPLGVPTETVRILQRSAHETNAAFGAPCASRSAAAAH